MGRVIRRAALALMFCAAVFSHVLCVREASARSASGLIYKKNSLYHQILVYRYGSIVTLQFGKRRPMIIQSQVDVSNPRRHVQEYTVLAFCGLLYNPEPERVLVVGLGGGVIPREMRHYFPDLEIDVAEIDPEIPSVADTFFGFREDDKLKVHVADGRVFIRKQLRRDPVPKYDIVILDACTSDYIPFHLMTREFLQEVKGVLADDGVVVANAFYDNRLFDAQWETFLAVFGRCQVFFGAYSTNAMLVAGGPAAPTLTVGEAAKRATALHSRHEFVFDLRSVARQLRPNARPGPRAQVLTDDQAPVNWLRAQQTGRSPGAPEERP